MTPSPLRSAELQPSDGPTVASSRTSNESPEARTSQLPGRLAVPSTTSVPGHAGRYAVCRICHGPARPGCPVCWSCRVVVGQLGGFEVPATPIFLFAPGCDAHGALIGYKAAPTFGGRQARATLLAEVLATYLARHLGCLCGSRQRARAAKEPIGLVPVPSSIGGRASWSGGHPLVALCRSAASQLETGRVEVLDTLRPTSTPPRRLAADRDGFVVTDRSAVKSRSLVVVDDVFTSGARIFSAAAALADAGARVPAVLPIGRLVRPDHNATTAALFADLLGAEWSPERCGRCQPDQRRVLARAEHRRGVVVHLVLAA